MDKLERDFNRDAWCLLGIVFDNCSLEEAEHTVAGFVKSHDVNVIVTPNVNFIVTASNDTEFREAILQSEYSLVDGMPLIWIARFLRLVLFEKVSGSSLIHDLLTGEKKAEYKLFCFGAAKGVARKASLRINRMKGKIRCVGHHYPGFCSIDDMTTKETIERINCKKPDIVLVSLGAKKGALWIKESKKALNAKIVSHVGAVLNFIAGEIKRAPDWMQRYGLEWFFRISQETILIKRYAHDGFVFLSMLLCKVVPYGLLLRKFNDDTRIFSDVTVKSVDYKHRTKIEIAGACTWVNLDDIRECFKKVARRKRNVIMDFNGTTYVDAAFLGLFLILIKWQRASSLTLEVQGLNKVVRAIMRFNLIHNYVQLK